MRKKSISKMIKFSLDFETVEARLPSDQIVNFDFY